MGESIDLAPGKFLGEKIVTTGFFYDLGHSSRIPENIREPKVFNIKAEFIHKKVLAVKELPHHRFSGNQISICFHPHTALYFPAAFPDSFFDFIKKFGIMFFHKTVQLGLGCPENIIRIFFHQS